MSIDLFHHLMVVLIYLVGLIGTATVAASLYFLGLYLHRKNDPLPLRLQRRDRRRQKPVTIHLNVDRSRTRLRLPSPANGTPVSPVLLLEDKRHPRPTLVKPPHQQLYQQP